MNAGEPVELRGIGLAAPPHAAAQEALAASAVERCCTRDAERRLLSAYYRRTTVERRGSVLLDAAADADPSRSERGGAPEQGADSAFDAYYPPPGSEGAKGPATEARMERFAREAPRLAERAASRALADAGTEPAGVDQLVVVTCTGFASPGLDFELMDRLGLPETVGRTQVGFMGCHGAINGLRAARGLVAAEPGSTALLVCVELCTLHFQYGWDPQRVLANALFADGAAAAVLRSAARPAPPTPAEPPRLRLRATASRRVPDSAGDMTWSIGGHGFVMSLSPRVPDLIESHLRPWLDGWLADHGCAVEDVTGWAIHPGGPRILDAVERTLRLPPHAADASRSVLREHGNMSSPTVLFVLQELIDRGVHGPVVAIAFGPGLVAEAALIDAP